MTLLRLECVTKRRKTFLVYKILDKVKLKITKDICPILKENNLLQCIQGKFNHTNYDWFLTLLLLKKFDVHRMCSQAVAVGVSDM